MAQKTLPRFPHSATPGQPGRRWTPCTLQSVSLMSAPNRAIQLLEAETRPTRLRKGIDQCDAETRLRQGHRLLRRLYPFKCEVWVPVESTPMQGLTSDERGLQC